MSLCDTIEASDLKFQEIDARVRKRAKKSVFIHKSNIIKPFGLFKNVFIIIGTHKFITDLLHSKI